MKQVDIYLSVLVSYPQFSKQIIERAMKNDGVTERNISALRSIQNSLIESRGLERENPEVE